MKSIPVIGVPILNGFHWLHRLVLSVDFPVDEFFILNNGNPDLIKQIDTLASLPHPYIKKFKVTHLPANIGVPGAWNLIIKSYLTAPYWVLPSHDIAFDSGFLEEMHFAAQDERTDMVHGYAGDFGDGGYDIFLITEKAVQKYGLFDENFSPAYGEDLDYTMRFAADKIHNNASMWKYLGLDHGYWHGDGRPAEYLQHGSQTARTGNLGSRLDRSHYKNWEYLYQKWGQYWREISPDSPYPMRIEGMPLSYTSFDLEFVRSKQLDRD
jgi:hypothetical protein